MKRIMLLIFLLGLILLSSCNGFQKVNEFSFETIYSDEKIIIKVNGHVTNIDKSVAFLLGVLRKI